MSPEVPDSDHQSAIFPLRSETIALSNLFLQRSNVHKEDLKSLIFYQGLQATTQRGAQEQLPGITVANMALMNSLKADCTLYYRNIILSTV